MDFVYSQKNGHIEKKKPFQIRTYPRVTFGLHHASMKAFLVPQMLTPVTSENTMWLTFVGESSSLVLAGFKGDHLFFKVKHKADPEQMVATSAVI